MISQHSKKYSIFKSMGCALVVAYAGENVLKTSLFEGPEIRMEEVIRS